MKNDFDLNLKLVSETSDEPYSGVSIWKSSNLEIKETRGGGKRQGYQGVYSVFYKGAFIKDIKFDYAKNLKKELENIEI
jgi:hypothetical protein